MFISKKIFAKSKVYERIWGFCDSFQSSVLLCEMEGIHGILKCGMSLREDAAISKYNDKLQDNWVGREMKVWCLCI